MRFSDKIKECSIRPNFAVSGLRGLLGARSKNSRYPPKQEGRRNLELELELPRGVASSRARGGVSTPLGALEAEAEARRSF